MTCGCGIPIPFEMDIGINVVGGQEYDGEYEITPTTETQVLHTAGLMARRDITINPIPNNYGLITWNGSTLTVS